MNSGEFLKIIFDFLNSNVEYVVLRNYEGLPERNNSRDIDVAIRRRDFQRIKLQLVGIMEECGWKVVTFLHSDRLITWVLGRVDAEGYCEVEQLDFFFDTSVFGIRLLSANELLAGRVFNGNIYHAGNDIEFLDKYMYDRAVGAPYPEKYRSIRHDAEKSEYVRTKLRHVFGCSSIGECDMTSSMKMLFHAFLKAPVRSLINMIRFEYHRVRNYIRGTGFSVGFTGPDGVGKTTVIEGLTESMGDVFRKAHEYYHFRPTLFGNLGEVAHTAGLKREVDRNYSDPHRGGKTGMLSSLVRLTFYSIDYILGYFLKVKTVTRITRIVIFDRYFSDIVCDSRRSRIYLPVKFLYWWERIFIPCLDYNIMLTADTDTILARKGELDAKSIEDINSKIDFLADKRGYYKVLNNSTPRNAISRILGIIFERQNAKNLKRLGYKK